MIKNIFLLKIFYPEHSYRLVVLAPRQLAITQRPALFILIFLSSDFYSLTGSLNEKSISNSLSHSSITSRGILMDASMLKWHPSNTTT